MLSYASRLGKRIAIEVDCLHSGWRNRYLRALRDQVALGVEERREDVNLNSGIFLLYQPDTRTQYLPTGY
jgi:hypothetical protein